MRIAEDSVVCDSQLWKAGRLVSVERRCINLDGLTTEDAELRSTSLSVPALSKMRWFRSSGMLSPEAVPSSVL